MHFVYSELNHVGIKFFEYSTHNVMHFVSGLNRLLCSYSYRCLIAGSKLKEAALTLGCNQSERKQQKKRSMRRRTEEVHTEIGKTEKSLYPHKADFSSLESPEKIPSSIKMSE